MFYFNVRANYCQWEIEVVVKLNLVGKMEFRPIESALMVSDKFQVFHVSMIILGRFELKIFRGLHPSQHPVSPALGCAFKDIFTEEYYYKLEEYLGFFHLG